MPLLEEVRGPASLRLPVPPVLLRVRLVYAGPLLPPRAACLYARARSHFQALAFELAHGGTATVTEVQAEILRDDWLAQ